MVVGVAGYSAISSYKASYWNIGQSIDNDMPARSVPRDSAHAITLPPVGSPRWGLPRAQCEKTKVQFDGDVGSRIV